MRKILTLFAACVFGAMALLSNPGTAEARHYRHGNAAGAAIAAAVIGGIVLYGISRHHNRHRYYSRYDDGYGYDSYPRHRSYSYSSAPNYGHRNYGGHRSNFSYGGFGGGHHRGHHW